MTKVVCQSRRDPQRQNYQNGKSELAAEAAKFSIGTPGITLAAYTYDLLDAL